MSGFARPRLSQMINFRVTTEHRNLLLATASAAGIDLGELVRRALDFYFEHSRVAHAISVRQPYAWAILAGHKRIESRTWRIKYRGPLLIHAAKTLAPRSWWAGRTELEQTFAGLDLETLPRGVLLGWVDLIDIVPAAQCAGDPWASGPWCWVLARPRLLARPVVWKGAAGLMRVANFCE